MNLLFGFLFFLLAGSCPARRIPSDMDKFLCWEGTSCAKSSASEMAWFRVVRRPPLGLQALQGHTATLVNNKVFVIGGSMNSICSSSVFVFNPSDSTLQRMPHTDLPARQNHISFASLNGSHIFVFGGHCGDDEMTDLIRFDPETHLATPVETTGQAPTGQNLQGLVMNNHLVVIGAFGGVHTLNLESFVWVQQNVTGETIKNPLTLFANQTTLYLIGNSDNTTSLFSAEFGVWNWTAVQTQGTVPPPMQFASSSLISSSLYFLGGCPSHAQPQQQAVSNNQTLELPQTQSQSQSLQSPQPQTQQQSSPSHPSENEDEDVIGPTALIPAQMNLQLLSDVVAEVPASGSCDSRLFVLDLATMTWRVENTTGMGPASLENPASTVVGNRIVLVGGCLSCLSDMYVLDTEIACQHNCNAHGTCSRGLCQCDSGFSGQNCETDLRCPNNCSNNGYCHNASCICRPPFQGDSCQAVASRPSATAVAKENKQAVKTTATNNGAPVSDSSSSSPQNIWNISPSSTVVFVLLGVGVAAGTLLGVVAKTFWRTHPEQTQEYF